MEVKRTANGLTLNGRPNKLNVRSGGNKIIFENPVFGDDIWERVEPWKPTDLGAFVGVFTSDEAEARLSIVIKDHELVAHNSPHASFALQPTYADDFWCELGSIHFERDRTKNVVGLRLSGERVWDLQFARQKPGLPLESTETSLQRYTRSAVRSHHLACNTSPCL
jgi:hypothetical protein